MIPTGQVNLNATYLTERQTELLMGKSGLIELINPLENEEPGLLRGLIPTGQVNLDATYLFLIEKILGPQAIYKAAQRNEGGYEL